MFSQGILGIFSHSSRADFCQQSCWERRTSCMKYEKKKKSFDNQSWEWKSGPNKQRGPHRSTFSPNSKRLHYRRFLPRDTSVQPTVAAHLLYLHVSLIRVRVYSLKDQLPAETAGCVIKGLTLGAPPQKSDCRHMKKTDILKFFICTISVKVLRHVCASPELVGASLLSDANATDWPKKGTMCSANVG